MSVDAKAAASRAVEIAAREIDRLGVKQSTAREKGLDGDDIAALERLAKVCLAYDDHELHWLSKLDPAALPDELLARLITEGGGTSDGARPRRKRADG